MTDQTKSINNFGVVGTKPHLSDMTQNQKIVITMEAPEHSPVRIGYGRISLDEIPRLTLLALQMNMRVSLEQIHDADQVEFELEGTRQMFDLISLHPSVIMVDHFV